jgi:hypothetical protein
MCGKYHGLNKITVKNHFLLPFIFQLFTEVSKATIFIEINCQCTCIKEGDAHVQEIIMQENMSSCL